MVRAVEGRGAKALATALGFVLAAVLGVATAGAAKAAIPAGGVDITTASLDWLGNEEVQSAPPFGGSNFLSAGLSNGKEATYQATAGNAAIYQVSATGEETLATWATRAAHVSDGGRQVARLYAGQGHIDSDGSGSVAWQGSFSVNFYGGLVPFTITDPEIRFAADGTGRLVADLEGCSSSMENPNECAPLAPSPEAVIATFKGVHVDPAEPLTVEPEYAGVEVDIPADSTPQNREVAGWGAWPQPFVDFQLQTGLSSYWYSSGGAADPKKPPLPFTVDFGGVVAPEPEAPGGGSDPDVPATTPASDPPADPPAPVAAAPAAKKARVALQKGVRKLDARGTAPLARVACPAGAGVCRLVVPARTAARIGGKRHLLTVLAPARIKAGASASVRVRLARAARVALGAKKLSLRVPIVVNSGGGTSKWVAKVTIVGRG